MASRNRFKKAWNAFVGYEKRSSKDFQNLGPSSSYRPDRSRLRYYNERSIISSIYTRIGIDVSGVLFRHIKVGENERYLEDVDSPLNSCFVLEPNLDQGPRAFRQDIAMTLFDEGVAAIVPVDTSDNPTTKDRFDIHTLRVGKITKWHPQHIQVSLYNEERGIREEIICEKRHVAIVENPLYSVMNEPNSTLQRLIRKLSLIDNIDDASAGKLDLIIQLPYVIKSETRRDQAEKRRQEIEFQLKSSQYGIAYADGTEKITQLNRPAENQLLKQVEYLTNLLYNQLGITTSVMDGTADEASMLNYYNRTVDPIIEAISEAMMRAFIGPIGYKNDERIGVYRDPFKLVPISQISDIADRFARNEVLTSNEIRSTIGFRPSTDPKADELRNSNMPQPLDQGGEMSQSGPSFEEMDGLMNEVFDGLTADIDQITQGIQDE